MKRLSPPSGGGPSLDRKDGVVVQFPRTRSSARPASPTTLFSNNPPTANDAERYFCEFAKLQRLVHQTLDPTDGARAAVAFRKFLYAFNQLEDRGLS